MINGRSILAIIPARGGSKGIPRKNIKSLAGKPLVAWTIEEAKKSKYIDRLILSSEDEEIINIAKEWGCEVPFVRPADIARDETAGIDPIIHALNELPGYDIVLVLQPTSPLRKVEDIDQGLEFFEKESASVCVSISEITKTPYSMFLLDTQNRLHRIIDQKEIFHRRQDLPQVYMPNGALFISKTKYLQQRKSFYTEDTIGFIMVKERAHDIDDKIDFLFVEFMMATYGS